MHPKRETVLEESRHFLKAFEIDFDEQFIFKDP